MARFSGLLAVALVVSTSAQNPPTVASMPDDTVTVGSGQDYLVVPGIDDGETGTDQTISVAAVSSNPAILSIDGVDYTSGDKTAVVRVTEGGTNGAVTVTVTVTDPDGSTDGAMTVRVAPINNPGILFEIHDIVFWQREVPLTKSAVYSRVLQEARITNADLNFDEIPITVNLDCATIPPCTGNDFFTELYKGYLTVPTTGDYTFYVEGVNERSMGLSTNDEMDKAVVIIDSYDKIGTDAGSSQWRSASQTLTAGVVYAIYATQWVVHIPPSGILWEGPGITKEYIPGEYLMPTYSLEKPGAPEQLVVTAKGNDYLRVAWSPSSTTGVADSYSVFVDGVERLSVSDTATTISGLSLSTTYSVFIVASDRLGKRSFPSNVVTETTFGADGTAPSPPTSVSKVTVSDLAAEIQWSGASDNESAVSYYNIYVNGTQHNAEPWFEESIILQNLAPSTAYSIEIEAADGGGNVSARSTPLAITTLAFDPDAPELGMKKAAVTFSSTAIANACGTGINTNYKDGDIFTPNIRGLLDELQPNLLRWGALTANPLSFSQYSGAGKQVTYAKFLQACNQRNAYCAITTGISNGTDWVSNTQAFVNFIEYLNGPSTSTYGAVRAAEGITQPLMAGSKGLLIELGNEVWGAGAHNAPIGADYAAYGAWCRQVALLMKASPYWDSSKMYVVYSGRNPHPQDSYGLNFRMMQGDAGEVEILSVSGYLGGNMNYDPEIAPGKSEGDYYKAGFRLLQRNLDGLVATIEWEAKMLSQYKPTFFYETNMTTTSYNGRLGQAVAMIDYMASAIEHGSVLPSLFHLTGGQWKIVRTAEGNRKLPLFTGASLYNRNCQGLALGGSISTQGRLVDANGRTFTMDPVGYHLYNNGANYTILLTSRDFQNDYTVQVFLPAAINPGTSGRKIVVTGSDFSTVDAVVDSSDVTLSSGMLVTVPKYSLVFIRFSGTGLDKTLPLGYYSDRTSVLDRPALKPEMMQNRKADVPYEIYDLLGKRVILSTERTARMRLLPSAVYIYKQGNEIKKVHKVLLPR